MFCKATSDIEEIGTSRILLINLTLLFWENLEVVLKKILVKNQCIISIQ